MFVLTQSRTWTFYALGLLLSPSLTLASESGSFAPGVTPPNFMVPQGQITLKMKPDSDPDGVAYFRYNLASGAKQWLLDFSQASKCNYSSKSNLVSLSTNTGGVGYRAANNGYGIGVTTPANQGTDACTQIDSSESLSIDFRSGLGNLFLDYADLDMLLKYTNTVVTIKLYKDEPSDVSPTNLVYTYTRTCDIADCGPDSFGNDDYRVRVPIAPQTVLFNRMTISVGSSNNVQGAATLMGRVDPGTTPSVFNVVSAGTPLTCNTTFSSSNGGTSATVFFYTDPGVPCPADKTFLFNAQTHEIDLLLNGNDPTVVHAIVTTAWAPEPLVDPVPVTTAVPPGEPEVWCDGTQFAPSMLAGHTWCRISQSSVILGNGFMQVTEKSLLDGDASLLR